MSIDQILQLLRESIRRCPACGIGQLRPLRRSVYDLEAEQRRGVVAPAVPMVVCDCCGERLEARRPQPAEPEPPPVEPELEPAPPRRAAAAVADSEILKRLRAGESMAAIDRETRASKPRIRRIRDENKVEPARRGPRPKGG